MLEKTPKLLFLPQTPVLPMSDDFSFPSRLQLGTEAASLQNSLMAHSLSEEHFLFSQAGSGTIFQDRTILPARPP